MLLNQLIIKEMQNSSNIRTENKNSSTTIYRSFVLGKASLSKNKCSSLPKKYPFWTWSNTVLSTQEKVDE